MPGARLEGVRAVRAAQRTRRPEHDRRALVVRLVGDDARSGTIGMRVPGALERDAIALWAMALEELPILTNIGLDEILRCLLEHRPPLLRVRRKQRAAAPALQS